MTNRHELFMKERMKMEQDKWQAVSPKHYKEIVPGMQYMQMMYHILKDFKGDEAHLMGQIYKYLMRYGKKDDKNQELGKVYWYLCYLMINQGMCADDLHSTLTEIEDMFND